MINIYKEKKKKVNTGGIYSKNMYDKINNNSSINEKFESKLFEWSLQKVKYRLNIIELILILDEWLQSEVHERNHAIGEDALKLKLIRKCMCIFKNEFQRTEG